MLEIITPARLAELKNIYEAAPGGLDTSTKQYGYYETTHLGNETIFTLYLDDYYLQPSVYGRDQTCAAYWYAINAMNELPGLIEEIGRLRNALSAATRRV